MYTIGNGVDLVLLEVLGGLRLVAAYLVGGWWYASSDCLCAPGCPADREAVVEGGRSALSLTGFDLMSEGGGGWFNMA